MQMLMPVVSRLLISMKGEIVVEIVTCAADDVVGVEAELNGLQQERAA